MSETYDVELSFVSPVYGCPEAVAPLCERIGKVCEKLCLSYEIILVDDCCPKDSWSRIQDVSARDEALRGFKLSRNFGQHAAIEAGLNQVRGRWVVVLDCDLQDQPEFVEQLYAKAQEGFDVVRARRQDRQDSWYRRAVSKAYYAVLGYLTGTKQDAGIANFGIYHRRVIDAMLNWHEQQRFFPATVEWVGFKRTEIEVEHAERHSGESSYNFRRLLSLGIKTILAFSDKPLRLVIYFGLLIALAAFAVGIIIFFYALSGDYQETGWASLIVSIWFLGGVIMSVLGLSGLYIGRTLAEAKQRPTYIIGEEV